MVRQIALILALVSIVLSYDTQLMLANLKEQEVLPRAVKPNFYFLKLHPRISEGYFNGSVDIQIQCLEPTQVIVLHAHQNLQLENISLTAIRTGYDVPAITEVARNESTDTLTLTLEEELTERDSYRLHVEFHGLLKDMAYQYGSSLDDGFFRNQYTDYETRETRWYAMTSMFPGVARSVFPCFDEPSFKAEFRVSVSHLTNMSVLTGWPSYLNQSTGEEDYVKDYFVMNRIAPFSVGILVSEINNTSVTNVTSSQGTVELAVHHVCEPLRSENTTLMLKVLQFLQDYLQARFPLDKLNIVALPRQPFYSKTDFSGLIILEESTVSENHEDLYNAMVKQWMTHMVTPETWSAFNISDLLESYLARFAMSKMSNKKLRFTGQSRSFLYGQFATNFTVSSEWRPYSMEKGLWFLEMLNESLGEQTFRKALGLYVRDNMYTPVTENTLWSVMQQQALEDDTLPSNVSLQQVANTWLDPDCLRYPVLTVTRNYDDRSASLEQHVFSTELPRSLTASEEALLWWLPVAYISPGTTVPHLAAWMGTRHLEITGLPEVDEYIVVNPTDAGMFLVNYDPHNWRLLKRDFSQLPVNTRAKLMNDAMLLAEGGELDYVLTLNLTLNLLDETYYSVWTPLLKHLQYIEPRYSSTPVEDKLNVYLRFLLAHLIDLTLQPEYERVGSYGSYNRYGSYGRYSDYDEYYVRDQLNRLGYQPRADEAYKSLQESMPTFLVNDTNSGMVVFCPEFMRDGSEDWEAHNEELQTFLSHQYQSKPFLERSLAKCPGYSELIERILKRTLDDNVVITPVSWYSMVSFITSSSKAQNISLEFFFHNYNELRHRFYFMEEFWTSLVSRVTDRIKTEETLSKLNELCKEHEGKLGYTQSVFEEAVKKATKKIEWCRRNLPDIKLWLDEVLPRADVM